jgi:hypothetical protein
MTMLILGHHVPTAQPPPGWLIVPDHHRGELGDNEITVTATGLADSYDYFIEMYASYAANPRTPPEQGECVCEGIGDYFETSPIFMGPSDLDWSITVQMPDCHCQVHAEFTLYYWAGDSWDFNGDDRAAETVSIWHDCIRKTYVPLVLVER